MRSETNFADACNCGSNPGNCGQYVPSPPATNPTLIDLRGRGAGVVRTLSLRVIISPTS